MVKEIEKFCAELEVCTFRHPSNLLEREIEVVDSWSATDGPWRIAKQLEGSRGCGLRRQDKCRGIERIASVCPRILSMKRSDLIWLPRQLEVKTVFELRVIV